MGALPNRRRKLTGKDPHHSNIHPKEIMTSTRKTITETMIMAMVMRRDTMTSTINQAMVEELVHADRIHCRVKATLHNKDIMITAGPEVVETQDHKGVTAEGEAQIMGDHQQRIVVEMEVEAEEVTQMAMVRP
jgi:hypothetical protein